MRGVTSCWIALILVGCNKPADKPADATVGEASAMETAPATIALADVAGTWNVRSTVEGSERIVPQREPIPVRVVAVEGDSIVSEARPTESALRKGVQVSTRVVSRLQDGRLVGTTVARYQVTGPDTVSRLRFMGTRAL